MRRNLWLAVLLTAAASHAVTLRHRAVAPPSNAANVVVSIGATGRALPKGFSGINFGAPENALRYTDPQAPGLLTMLNAGWVRFPGGTVGNPHNWETGDMSATVVPFPYTAPSQWVCTVEQGVKANGNLNGPCIAGSPEAFLETNQTTNMGKGYTKLSDFRVFAANVGALITANTFTDTTEHIAALAQAACNSGMNVILFELSNEAYLYPGRWARGSAYFNEMQGYRSAIASNCPGAHIAPFYAGNYWGGPPLAPNWDSDLFSLSSGWDDIGTHIYPQFTTSNCGTECAQQAANYLNGILANDTNAYFDSYFVARKPNAWIEVSELNIGMGDARTLLQQTVYQAIFLSEYIARVSSDSHIQYIGVHQVYQPGGGNGSMILAGNDHLAQVQTAARSSSGPINTTGFDFGFKISVAGTGLALTNAAVNKNTTALTTTVTGGPSGAATVAASPTDPTVTTMAVFAQAYGSPPSASRSVVVTNKGPQPQIVELIDNGVEVTASLTVSSLSGTSVSDTAPVSSTSAGSNPVTIPPFSVVRIDY